MGIVLGHSGLPHFDGFKSSGYYVCAGDLGPVVVPEFGNGRHGDIEQPHRFLVVVSGGLQDHCGFTTDGHWPSLRVVKAPNVAPLPRVAPHPLVAVAEADRFIEGFVEPPARNGRRHVSRNCRFDATVCVKGKKAAALHLKSSFRRRGLEEKRWLGLLTHKGSFPEETIGWARHGGQRTAPQPADKLQIVSYGKLRS